MILEQIGGFEQYFRGREGKPPEGMDRTVRPLKYGEAMANAAAHAPADPDKRMFRLVNGDHPVGFVNHMDVIAAAHLMATTCGTVIIKHTMPCGAARGFASPKEEYEAASEVDPVACLGSIIGAPKVTCESAREMVGASGRRKRDAVVSFEFEEGAVGILLQAQKPPLVYEVKREFDVPLIDVQQGLDGPIFQERLPPLQRADLQLAAGDAPRTEQVLDDLVFGMHVAAALYSNSICFVERTAKEVIAVGMKGGTPDRVSVARGAMENAVMYYLRKYLGEPKEALTAKANGDIGVQLYMASDGFFPDPAALSLATASQIECIKKRLSWHPDQPTMDSFGERTLKLIRKEGWNAAQKMQVIAGKLDITVPYVISPGGSQSDANVADYALEQGMVLFHPMRDGKHLRFFKHAPLSPYRVR